MLPEVKHREDGGRGGGKMGVEVSYSEPDLGVLYQWRLRQQAVHVIAEAEC